MKRSNIWYGYFTWMVAWIGGCLNHFHPIAAFTLAVGGYALLVLTSREE